MFRQVIGGFLLAIFGIFFFMPAWEYCFNWWWRAIRDRNKPQEPPLSPEHEAIRKMVAESQKLGLP